MHERARVDVSGDGPQGKEPKKEKGKQKSKTEKKDKKAKKEDEENQAKVIVDGDFVIIEQLEGPTSGKKRRWVTRDMADEMGRQDVLKATLWEGSVYMCFFLILVTYTLSDRASSRFLLNKAVIDQIANKEFVNYHGGLIKFNQIREIVDIWNYLEYCLVESLYWNYYYDVNLQKLDEEKKVFLSNYLVAVPRIRQVRVHGDSCALPKYFQETFEHCYGDYTYGNRDKEPFGLKQDPAWVYSGSSVTKSISTSGKYATYRAGGYYMDFKQTKAETLTALQELKNDKWIDRGTRAVFVDVSIYNPNVNLFAICKIVFELPPSGGVDTDIKLHIAGLVFLPTVINIFRTILEYAFYIFTLYFFAEEIRDIIYLKKRYFKHFWNYIDLMICLMGLTIFCLNITRAVIAPSYLRTIKDNPDKYGNLEVLGELSSCVNVLMSITVFLVSIKIFKYINVNKSMSQLHVTLKRCALDMLAFLVLFFIVFVAFSLLGYLLFGRQVKSYSYFTTAMFTLLRTVLGDFDYQEIEEQNKIMAPIFFLSFVFIVFFVLLNMFLAIINDAYSEVKTELSITTQEMHMLDYIKIRLHKLFRKCKWKIKLKTEDATAYNETILYLKETLKRFGFTDMEIEMFFARFNIKMTAPADFDQEKLIQQLEHPPKPPDIAEKTDIGFVKMEDFKEHQKRLLHIESTTAKLTTQLDDLIQKIDKSGEKK